MGPAYLAHVRRSIHNHSFEEHDKHTEEERRKQADGRGDEGEEDDLGVGEEEEDELLLAQDPKEWKVSCFTHLCCVIMLSVIPCRNKTITPSSVSRISGTKPRRIK